MKRKTAQARARKIVREATDDYQRYWGVINVPYSLDILDEVQCLLGRKGYPVDYQQLDDKWTHYEVEYTYRDAIDS